MHAVKSAATVFLSMAALVAPALATPIFVDTFESDTLLALACELDLQRVQPPGFTEHVLPWSNVFYGATFPNSTAYLAPVGAFTLRHMDLNNRGLPLNARYYATPFVPAANSNYKISWLQAQSIAAVAYYNPRLATSVFVSVSRCKGDLRRPDEFSADSELSRCRSQRANGNLFFGTSPNSQCPLITGVTYYLNFAFVDTTIPGPLSTLTTTCVEGTRCEANFKAQ